MNRILAVVVLLATFQAVAHAQSRAPFQPPPGWLSHEENGLILYAPPDLESGEACALLLLPEEPLDGDFREWFVTKMRLLEQGLEGVMGSAVNERAFQGGEALDRTAILNGPNGPSYRYYAAARRGTRVRMIAYLANDKDLFQEHADEVVQSLGTFDFDVEVAGPAPTASPTAQPTPTTESPDTALFRNQIAIQGDLFKALQLKSQGKYKEALALYVSCRDRAKQAKRFPDAEPGSWKALYNDNMDGAWMSAATSVQTTLVDVGRFEEALAQSREVLAAIDEQKQPLASARVHHALSDAYKGLLQYEKALREAEKSRAAADLFVQLAPAKFQAWASLKEMDKATARQVQEFYEACSEARQIYMKTCNLLDLVGRFEEVIATYTSPAYKDLARLLESRATLDTVGLSLKTQYGDEFGKVILQKFELLNAQNDYQVETAIGFAWRMMAVDTQQPDLYDKAQETVDNLRKLVKAYPQMFGPMHASVIEGGEAQVYKGRRQWKEARQSIERALKLAEPVESQYRRELEFNLQLALVDVLLEERPADLARVRKAVDRARALTREQAPSDSTWRWRLPFGEGRVLAAEGKRDAAAQALSEAVSVIEKERTGLEAAELKETFFRGRQPVYEEYIKILHDLGRDADAMAVMERVRSRSLLDVLRDVSIKKGVSPTLASQMDRIRKEEQALVIERNRRSATGEAVRGGSTDLEKQKARTFADILRESPELADLKGADPLPADRIAALLDDQTVLLEYIVGDRYAAVIVLTQGRQPRLVTLVDGDTIELTRNAAQLRAELGRGPGKDRWKEPAAALYQVLLAPVADDLKGHARLVILPYGRLHYIPWTVLGPANGPLILDQYDVVLLPSASVLQFCRDKNRQKKATLTAFALGNLSAGDMPALPGTHDEVKAIVALYPKAKAVEGKGFTMDAVRKGTKGVDLLHFATHGVFDFRAPEASAIVAADGRLGMQDIFNLDLTSSLVVLSACETGRGEVYSGNEMVGLVRAFMYAGTPSVVATLWQVADDSTAELMVSYYEALRTADKAAALRQAQQKLRVTHPHPFFWAPFVLVGDWK